MSSPPALGRLPPRLAHRPHASPQRTPRLARLRRGRAGGSHPLPKAGKGGRVAGCSGAVQWRRPLGRESAGPGGGGRELALPGRQAQQGPAQLHRPPDLGLGTPNHQQMSNESLECLQGPKFFHSQPDMTFYREDVVLDDRIHGYLIK